MVTRQRVSRDRVKGEAGGEVFARVERTRADREVAGKVFCVCIVPIYVKWLLPRSASTTGAYHHWQMPQAREKYVCC